MTFAARKVRFSLCTLLAAALSTPAAFAATAAGVFIDLRAPVPIQGDVAAGQAKAAVCMACHGAAGISPVLTFPNLAGQKADYLYWRLVGFKRAARPDSPMTAQVAPLDDADLRNLSAYFAQLTPVAAVFAVDAAADGRAARLFRGGDPAKGIAPCQGCHGVDGSGHPHVADAVRYRTYPVLRGQHADYLVQRLKEFRDSSNSVSSNERIMAGVARTLDDGSIESLARWLQSMPP